MTKSTKAPTFIPMSESPIFTAGLAYGTASNDAGKYRYKLAAAVKAEFWAACEASNSDDGKREVSKQAYIEAGEPVVISMMRARGISGFDGASDTLEGVTMRLRVREWLRLSVYRVKDWKKTAGLSEAEAECLHAASGPIGLVLKAAGLPTPNPRNRAPQTVETETAGDAEAVSKADARPENMKAPADADADWIACMVAFLVHRGEPIAAKGKGDKGAAARDLIAAVKSALAVYAKTIEAIGAK